MSVITLCLPSFDPPTRYMSSFLKRYILPRIITDLSLRSIALYRCVDQRMPFQFSTRYSNVIIGTGHGDSATLTGQFMNVLWETGNYDPAECEGKIIKFISCETGAELGPDLIRSGARAFQGYTKIFAFYAELNLRHLLLPWLDSTAWKFLMPPIESIMALLDGKTNEEAYDIEIRAWQHQIDTEDDPEIKTILEHNRNSLIMMGDPDARISSRNIRASRQGGCSCRAKTR